MILNLVASLMHDEEYFVLSVSDSQAIRGSDSQSANLNAFGRSPSVCSTWIVRTTVTPCPETMRNLATSFFTPSRQANDQQEWPVVRRQPPRGPFDDIWSCDQIWSSFPVGTFMLIDPMRICCGHTRATGDKTPGGDGESHENGSQQDERVQTDP
jgi:hypothetical protein